MIFCENCERAYMTTLEERLEVCPNCDVNSWMTFNVRPGRPLRNPRLRRAVERAPNRVQGLCFITPLGYVVPMAEMRHYEEVRKRRGTRTMRKVSFSYEPGTQVQELHPTPLPPGEEGETPEAEGQ